MKSCADILMRLLFINYLSYHRFLTLMVIHYGLVVIFIFDGKTIPGGGLYKVLYREAPPLGPTPFVYHFGRNGTPFL